MGNTKENLLLSLPIMEETQITVVMPKLTASIQTKVVAVDNQCSKAEQKIYHSEAVARFAYVVRQCARQGTLARGKNLHFQIVSDGLGSVTFLQNLLVNMYGRCGSLNSALSVFQEIEAPSVFSWTMVISASARNGDLELALDFTRRMLQSGVKPDEAAFVAVINVVAALEDYMLCRQVHAWVVASGYASGLVVGNALISMHCRCRDSALAEIVFAGMWRTDVVTWTSMAAAYARSGQHARTLQVFRNMDLEGVKINFVTLVTLIESCSRFSNLEQGKLMHLRAEHSGLDTIVTVSNALIHMYMKCGDLSSAIDVFRRMEDRNTVSWTSMMVAYTQHGYYLEALELFYRMELEGIKPDVVALVAVVDACGGFMVASKAKEIHVRAAASGFLYHVVPLANAVITMLGKCEGLDDARNVFESLRSKNEISWSSMIAAYAQNGRGNEAIRLFKLMVLDGLRPNESSLVTVLSAYSHSGSVQDCCECFATIASDYCIDPTREHYSVVVDLLGRVGMLDRAAEIIDVMPHVPDSNACLAMLSACVVHNDLEQGRAVSKRLFDLNPTTNHESPFILLSNIQRCTTGARLENINIKKQKIPTCL